MTQFNKNAFGFVAAVPLQIWAWDHIHIGRPDRVGSPPDLHDCPLGCRWNIGLRFRRNVKATDIEFYRDELDQQRESQVTWMPYTEDVLNGLPAFCLEGSAIWRSRTSLICAIYVDYHLR
ncbi:serine/threonine-protein phosphatase 7 long form homolog [Ananas comosus]|uniref:Serine/threonine-protein phosphatase 7 long form homolog n=1 Tax=Ananas comosus TaxID=4615 RepID=A0A6P5EFZ7_ANACO|nr:serine/threonine-protein phosphatase 7 long form homolog [Ananas comosus]